LAGIDGKLLEECLLKEGDGEPKLPKLDEWLPKLEELPESQFDGFALTL